MLCAQTWKLDMDGAPLTYTDEDYSWTWEPEPGDQYGAGDPGADYGTMKFNTNGTVTVNGESGTWTLDFETKKLSRSLFEGFYLMYAMKNTFINGNI